MGKYDKLTQHLNATKVSPLVLTFGQIEKILDSRLSPSYRQYSCLWCGRPEASPTHMLKKAIANAGYHVRKVNLKKEEVTLELLNTPIKPNTTGAVCFTHERVSTDRDPIANENNYNRKKVFIAHGTKEDDETKELVARFVQDMGFEPKLLLDEVSEGQTINEKLKKVVDDIAFGIVLYTPCDKGYEIGHEDKTKKRARQNVVYELGYLRGKLGDKKVCVLIKDGTKDEIEMPSDITGLAYIVYDSSGKWKEHLRQEMEAAGLNPRLS